MYRTMLATLWVLDYGRLGGSSSKMFILSVFAPYFDIPSFIGPRSNVGRHCSMVFSHLVDRIYDEVVAEQELADLFMGSDHGGEFASACLSLYDFQVDTDRRGDRGNPLERIVIVPRSRGKR